MNYEPKGFRLANRKGYGKVINCVSHDLMYDCWRRGLYGGLKRVEEQLGILRRTQGIDGIEAMRLWHRYETYRDEEALKVLLEYNREDVVNLKLLDETLRGMVRCG